jgi:hypothetical protein
MNFTSSAGDAIGRIVTYLINPAILVLFTAGFFLFMWGIVQMLWGSKEGKVDDTYKSHMIWGMVGMLIMISVYGIIALLDNTFSLNTFNGGPDMSRMNNVTAPVNFFGN